MLNSFGVNVPLPEDKPSGPSINEEEITMVWNSAPKPKEAKLIELLLCAGLRISEVLTLTAKAFEREG
jgi:hypothetical protein